MTLGYYRTFKKDKDVFVQCSVDWAKVAHSVVARQQVRCAHISRHHKYEISFNVMMLNQNIPFYIPYIMTSLSVDPVECYDCTGDAYNTSEACADPVDIRLVPLPSKECIHGVCLKWTFYKEGIARGCFLLFFFLLAKSSKKGDCSRLLVLPLDSGLFVFCWH